MQHPAEPAEGVLERLLCPRTVGHGRRPELCQPLGAAVDHARRRDRGGGMADRCPRRQLVTLKARIAQVPCGPPLALLACASSRNHWKWRTVVGTSRRNPSFASANSAQWSSSSPNSPIEELAEEANSGSASSSNLAAMYSTPRSEQGQYRSGSCTAKKTVAERNRWDFRSMTSQSTVIIRVTLNGSALWLWPRWSPRASSLRQGADRKP